MKFNRFTQLQNTATSEILLWDHKTSMGKLNKGQLTWSLSSNFDHSFLEMNSRVFSYDKLMR